MSILLALLLVLAVVAIVGTIGAVHADGYGPRPDRSDRTAARSRLL
jgi:hypothetical protein